MVKRHFSLQLEKLDKFLFRCDRDGPCRLPLWGELVRFSVLCGRVFGRNNVFMRSAAMAFISMIAVFPLAAVVLTLVPLYFHSVQNFHNYSAVPGASPDGVTTTAIALPAANPAARNGEAAKVTETSADGVTSASLEVQRVKAGEDYATQISSFLVDAIAPAGASGPWKRGLRELFIQYQSRSESIGAIGVIGLFIGALALYTTAQKAFNHIWKAKRQRSRLQSMAVFSGVLVWIPLLVFLSLAAKNLLVQVSPGAESTAVWLIPGVFTFIFFAAVYRYLPTVDVRWRSAILGALISTVLWMIMKGSIANYLMFHMRNIRNLILTVGTIPYFIMWMYVSWVIVLLGVVASYTHQNYHSLVAQESEETVTVIDPLILLLLLAVIGESFIDERGGVSYNELRDFCPISQPELNSHLTYLENRHYICQRANPEYYILQKPPDRILLSEFLTYTEKAEHLFLTDHEMKHDIVEFLRRFDKSILAFLHEMNLEQLVQSLRSHGTQVLDSPAIGAKS